MADKYPDNRETLTAALDHAWRWYEFRYGQVVQLFNFYILATAVLTTGYVTALNSKLYIVAGVVGLVVAGLSLATLLIGEGLRNSALLAAEPIVIMQGRLAASLGIEELRIVERHRGQTIPTWRAGTMVAPFALGVVMIAGIAAAFAAWLGH
jgi:hypothetical protein